MDKIVRDLSMFAHLSVSCIRHTWVRMAYTDLHMLCEYIKILLPMLVVDVLHGRLLYNERILLKSEVVSYQWIQILLGSL